jgi:hypothetical protein
MSAPGGGVGEWMDGWWLVEIEEMVDLHLDEEEDMMRGGRESRSNGVR